MSSVAWSGCANTACCARKKGSKGEPRFHMLETVREYASERLTASEEEEIVRERAHDSAFWTWRRRPFPDFPDPRRAAGSVCWRPSMTTCVPPWPGLSNQIRSAHAGW